MPWFLNFLILLALQGVVSGEPGFDNRIDFLIQPIISEDFVNTSLTLTCSGYYMLEGDNLKVDLDVLWYFEKAENEEETSAPSPEIITPNTRSQSGRLMFELSETRNTTLNFIAASAEYNGVYYCVVSKVGLSRQSLNAVYRYGGSPSSVFVVEPSFAEATQSSFQTLTCQTDPSLSQPPDIQWLFNPRNKTHYNIGNHEYAPYNLHFYNINSVRDTSVLQFVYASAEYDGEYYCEARFSEDRQHNSRSAFYKYSAGQDTNSYPFSVSIQVFESGRKKDLDSKVYTDSGRTGNDVSFVCTYSSFSEMSVPHFKWIFTPIGSTFEELTNGHELYEIENQEYGEHISRLKLKYSSAEYNGEYTCVVYGMMEAEEDTYSVSEKYMYWYNGVDIPPEFSMEPTFMVDNVTKLITESNIDLFCLVKQPDFYPPVQITWYRGSTKTEGARVPILPSNKMYSLSPDNTLLTFLTYSSYNNGTYHCEATNSAGTVVSRDALYQYGGYIKISEQLNPDNHTFSMVCNYSVANTNADSSSVTWFYEETPGNFVPVVASSNISLENDNASSISTVTFKSMSVEDVRRYKCQFLKTYNGKEKWAYGFHKPSVCTLRPATPVTDGSVVVKRGDDIVLHCSCSVSLSAGATFLFFKDRQGDSDKDLLERNEGTFNYNRMLIEHLSDNSGAQLTIPFARQQDQGSYQCGYEIAGEAQRIFVEGAVTVQFKGSVAKSENSPFGLGSYGISNGYWQNVNMKFNGEDVIATAMERMSVLLFTFFTSPLLIDRNIVSYNFTIPDIPDVFNKLPFHDGSSFQHCFSLYDETINTKDPTFQTLTYGTAGAPFEEDKQGDYTHNKAELQGRYTINYTINYNMIEDTVLPPYYPATLDFDVVFPDYEEQMVAPQSQYLVLSMTINEVYDQLTSKQYLKCSHCKTESPFRTLCPYPHSIVPSWSVEKNTPLGDSFDQLLEATNQDCHSTAPLGCGDLLINKIDMSLGRKFICTFHYTPRGGREAMSAEASQDIIVENVDPLKHDTQLSSQYWLANNVSLPLRRASGEPFTLIVYLDIRMRESLYEELVKVKWGELINSTVRWFPQDDRQVNNWQTKRLSYLIENFTDFTTYVCHVSYLHRVLTLQTPVMVADTPPPVSNISSVTERGDITFSWEESDNSHDNYFIGYKVSVTRKSAAPYRSGPVTQLPISTSLSREPFLTIGAEQTRAYSMYTLSAVAVYEDAESGEVTQVVISEENEPDPPSAVIVETNTQKLTDDDLYFLFELVIEPPAVIKGKILGYKIELFINVVEEDNMTKRRKKRAASDQVPEKVWTQTLGHEDTGFTEEGGYAGKVSFNITSGMEDINAIRVAAQTSKGYGEPLESEFVTFEQLFKKGSGTWIYIVVVLVVVFAIILSITVVCYVKRHHQVKKIIKTQYNPLYPIMRSVVPDQWEVNPDELKLSTALGEGAFGRVMKGALLKDGKTILVAVKMLKEESSNSETEAEALWKEIILMKKVGSHPYIVNIMGCVSVKTPICLLVEYVSNGDLQSFLRSHRIKFEKEHTQNMRKITSNIAKSATKSKQNGGASDRDADPLADATFSPSPGESPNSEYINIKSPDTSYINLQGVDAEEKSDILTSNHMLNMMYQIACGMQYLSYKNIIHRDLAARNILVCQDLSVKVSDFGLARDMYLEGQYMMNPRGRVPFKWMSPEALFDLKFTTKSDVWSYGVLLWEIVTLGGSPYPGIEPAKLYKLLKKGYRMARPDGCSIEIYDVMKDCWQEDPDLRPPFDDLSHTIQQLMSLDSEDYLTVGPGIASILEDEVEEAGAVEILSDEVKVQAAEQYSNVTRAQLSSSSSDQSRDNDNPKSPLLNNEPHHKPNALPTGPVLRRMDTLDFPNLSPSAPVLRPESNYSSSNFISESVL